MSIKKSQRTTFRYAPSCHCFGRYVSNLSHNKIFEGILEFNLYQIDAFAENVFEGNPAAVCPLDDWLTEDTLQKIAEENNLSETAFFVKNDDAFALRWFTPKGEVDLCGHATLAAAHVLFTHLNYSNKSIHFKTRSGILIVTKSSAGYEMDFPARMPVKSKANISLISDALGTRQSH